MFVVGNAATCSDLFGINPFKLERALSQYKLPRVFMGHLLVPYKNKLLPYKWGIGSL